MITSWRIVKKKHRKNAFNGEGARLYGGRWNPAGEPAVYTAGSLSLAALEILVHFNNDLLLYQVFVAMPATFDPTLIYTLPHRDLPTDWDYMPPSESTQKVGLEWIRREKHAILKVPSTVIRNEFNYVFNPDHPDFNKIKIGKPQGFKFDSRFIQ